MSLPSLPIDRDLAQALAVSLAIHGLALSRAPQPPAAATARGPLQATVLSPLPSPEKPAPSLNPLKAPEAPPKPALRPKPKSRPEPVERTYPKPVPTATTVPDSPAPAALPTGLAPAPSPAETAAPSAGAPSRADTVGSSAPDTLAAQPMRLGIDPGGLRQYHLALGRTAGRYKIYPLQARKAGWEGRVPLRISVSAAGDPVDVALTGSSGFPILDQAALEMMRQAASHTPVPEALRGRAFNVDLAVDYNIRDE